MLRQCMVHTNWWSGSPYRRLRFQAEDARVRPDLNSALRKGKVPGRATGHEGNRTERQRYLQNRRGPIDLDFNGLNGPGGIRTHENRIRNPEPYPC